MKEFNLHHAKLSEGLTDIPCITFDDFDSTLYGYILADSTTDCVYLICFLDQVYVTDDISCIINFIEMLVSKVESLGGFTPVDVDMFLQEYESFEEAYKVALMMHEDNELCYTN